MKSLIQRKKMSGFSIVETLVAIAILMISIAGPLVVVSKGLFAALDSRDQTIASFLAQESMEMIKNQRDNNMLAGGIPNWLTAPGIVSLASCTSATTCDASSLDVSPYVFCGVQTALANQSACPIYATTYGYQHSNASGPVTQFYRYFYLVPVTNTNDPEYTLHVVVAWFEGKIPFQIDIMSQLIATKR